MKYKNLIIFLIAVINLSVSGQDQLQGYIFDKLTSEPLPYATIGALHLQYGAYSDTSGMFILNYKNENDSLKISYLGYRSIYTSVINLRQNRKVYLEPIHLRLNEVFIKPSKTKKTNLELGYFSKEKGGFVLPPNYESYATYIPFPEGGEYVILKSIRFKYLLETNNSSLRIRILHVKDNGEPGDDLLLDNVIFENYKRHGKQIANIDISKYNLMMPKKGVFIVLEILNIEEFGLKDRDKRKGPAIGMIGSKKKSYSEWSNRYNSTLWRKYSDFPWTFAIGLIVTNYTE